ncbi:glycoside hydrolase family 2 TIM barrel-domain containing protein [Glycomyces sp. NPDC021274]|uniref:glycoside hydrolase family 2 TIM barrel-domain containing protein n=1 Tax=Glycomyces sp. NPDC021274 TaxID=3155120 RepID=UPI0033D063EE
MRPKTSIFAQLGRPAAAAEEVTLPHDALFSEERSAANPGKTAYFPSAAYEYSKTFNVPESYRTKRVAVEFQGAHRDAMVYVNDAFAGQRPFGYSAFTVPLDDHLRYGEENTITVEVRAHDDSRWYAGAGLYREATLIVTELIRIGLDGPRITTPDIDADRAMVEIAVPVDHRGLSAETVSVRTELLDPAGLVVAGTSAPITVRAGTTGVARHRLLVPEPQLWNVDTPHLYSAVVRLEQDGTVLDERRNSVGIRRLQLDPVYGLRINGVSTKLRGACIHHDNGLLGAAAVARAEERKIELLKAAGFNAIRSSHNPASSALLDACDRIGMLVMDEAFDIWTESKSNFDYSLAFPEWWERDIEAFVTKNRNHPSVIFYSIGNEIPETGHPLGSEWGRRLAEKIRELDDTRFITNGVNGFVSTLKTLLPMMQQRGASGGDGGVNDAMGNAGDMLNRVNTSTTVTERTAESFALLDAAGMNYGDARYEMDCELFPDRVIIGTETFPPHIDVNWALVRKHANVLGDFTWTGWDYLGEVGIGRNQFLDEPSAFEAPFPWLTAWCGDLDLTGYRRPASYYREIVFGLRTEPYIAVVDPAAVGREARPGQWAWSESIASWDWAVDPGTAMRVEVYSDAEEVELLLNDRSLGTRPAGQDHRFRAVFDLPYESGSIEAYAIRGGQRAERFALRSSVGGVRLAVTADRDVIRDDADDLAYLDIELRDSAGTLVTDADRTVTVTVDGAALAAVGSARPDNLERFDQGAHSTYRGRAQAIIRPTGPGPVAVTVGAEGLESRELRLSVK